MDKQIFAAMEISDHEIRLIVGELFNTRFNVIKVERVPVSGLSYYQITNEDTIVEAIEQAVNNASKTIGAKIERVLLCVPSLKMHRYPLKINVNVESMDKIVEISDIKRGIKKAMQTKVDPELALIQAVCVKYTINGITTRKLPVGEIADDLTIDIDLLCADRELAFGLVSCVEKAGLQIMDIYLDTFAVCKEAALFEQTVESNLILLKLERESTTLALISKGKLANCEVLSHGLGAWSGVLSDKTDLRTDMANRLVKYNARLDIDVHSDYPIYIWAEKDQVSGVTTTNTLSEKELCEYIDDNVEVWLTEIKTLCEPIIEAGPCKVVITGEGGEMQGLNKRLQEKLGVEVKNYCPQTLGVRNSCLSAPLGLFFAYKDQLPIIGTVENSVDMIEFNKVVSFKGENADGQEDTLSKKLKGMLFEARK